MRSASINGFGTGEAIEMGAARFSGKGGELSVVLNENALREWLESRVPAKVGEPIKDSSSPAREKAPDQPLKDIPLEIDRRHNATAVPSSIEIRSAFD